MATPSTYAARLAELEAYIQGHGHRPPSKSSLGAWIANIRGGQIDCPQHVRDRVAVIVATVPTASDHRRARTIRPGKPTLADRRAALLADMTAYVAENGHRPPMDHPQWWAFYGQVHRNRAPEFVALWESAPPAGSTHTIHFGLRGREYEVAVSREEAERIRAFLRPYVRAARPADPDRKPSPERPDSTRIGDHASMSGADGLVECLYCGHRARLLTPHLKHGHGVTAAEYRAEHNLPASASMMADADRARSSSKRRQMITEDPSRLDHLRHWHSPEHLKQMNAAAVEKVRASHQDETAREHRRPGRAYAAARMMEQRQRALAATVQSHGYDHIVDAIDKTRHLSTREAARLTGLGATTIARYRVRGDVGGAV